MQTLTKVFSESELIEERQNIEVAIKTYREHLEIHVETYYKDAVSLKTRIQMEEEQLEIPYALRANYMDAIQTAQSEVLEVILKEYC